MARYQAIGYRHDSNAVEKVAEEVANLKVVEREEAQVQSAANVGQTIEGSTDQQVLNKTVAPGGEHELQATVYINKGFDAGDGSTEQLHPTLDNNKGDDAGGIDGVVNEEMSLNKEEAKGEFQGPHPTLYINKGVDAVLPDGARDQDGGPDDGASATESLDSPKTKTWRRLNREGRNQSDVVHANTATLCIGRVRPRQREELDEEYVLHQAKRTIFQVLSLSECLGKEGLRKLQLAEIKYRENASDGINAGLMEGLARGKSLMEGEEAKAAAGPGATGTLSGANVSARQEP